MKKQLLLAGALFGIFQLQAQTPFLKKQNAPDKNHILLRDLLRHQSTNTAQKPTGLQQRVIAQSSSNMFSPEVDSNTFKYTGTRGSSFDFNGLDYRYNTSFTNTYSPLFRFPGDPRPETLLADSIRSYTDGQLYQYARAYYRTDNKIDSVTNGYDDGSGGFTPYKSINTFNPQGFLTKSFSLMESTPGVLDTALIYGYSYNSTFSRVERDSIWIMNSTPILVGVTTYHYNNNKLDSMLSWDPQAGPEPLNKYSFTYYNDGKLRTIKNYDYETGSPLLYYADTLGYTSGVDYHTFFQEEYYEDGNFSDGYREVKFPGANGLPDSIQAYERGSAVAAWGYSATLLPEYNSYHNPVAFYITTALTGTDTMARSFFYYETYNDGLSVKPLATNADFNVYPNPFTDNLSIEWKGKQQSNTTIQLINIAGQEVFKTSVKLNNGANSIHIPALNSGHYVLMIRDAEGKSWSHKMVKK